MVVVLVVLVAVVVVGVKFSDIWSCLGCVSVLVLVGTAAVLVVVCTV